MKDNTALAKQYHREYKEKNLELHLIYPNVLIRVIPKPDFFGSFYIPDALRNKPVYEGVVIKTYTPRIALVKGKEILLESGLKPGDHVLFPYWSGVPVPGLSDEEYRCIPDRSFMSGGAKQDSPEVMAVLTYEEKSIREELGEELEAFYTAVAGGPFPEDNVKPLLDKLLLDYDIVRREVPARIGYNEPTRPD
jgi:hypothetical protein